MQYLFNQWSQISKMIKEHNNTVLLCDYDGTLTPIVDTPEEATLSDETSRLLVRLVSNRHIVLAIVSGRALIDIKEKIGLSGVIYAGNHGLEIEGPGLTFVHPLTDELDSVLHLISIVLKKTMNNIKGVIVEDKGMTLSVHYRLVEEEKISQVNAIFENIVNSARKMGKIRTTSGKKVHEVRPAIAWDKGKAVQLIMEKYVPANRKKNILPVYLGDDRTDEDAFRVVNGYGGISVLVGDNEINSEARYSLNSTSEVNTFLSELHKMV